VRNGRREGTALLESSFLPHLLYGHELESDSGIDLTMKSCDIAGDISSLLFTV
jgi:hypothetical protein